MQEYRRNAYAFYRAINIHYSERNGQPLNHKNRKTEETIMLKFKINVVFLSGMESEWLVNLDKEVVVRNNDLYVDGVRVARNVDFIEKSEVVVC